MSGLGYFMQSLGQGLMSRPKEDKLSRERFEYQKDQDSKAQARAIVEQSQQDWLFEQQKLAEQQVFRENERQNAERVGMRDTILRTSGLMPPMADGWHKKEMFARTLPEVEYLAGIEKTNQAADTLGLNRKFTTPQDTAVLTTASNNNARQNQIDFETNKLDTSNKRRQSASLITAVQLGYNINEANRFSQAGLSPEQIKSNFEATKDKTTKFSTKDILADLDGLYKKKAGIQSGENILDVAGAIEGRTKAIKTIDQQIKFKEIMLRATSPEEVRKLFNDGELTKTEAEMILIHKFGME